MRVSPRPAVTHRKNHLGKSATRGSKSPFPKKRRRLVRQAAQSALLAVSFTAMQFFTEESAESKRLFDHRVVDNLQAPLTHYHE